MAKPPAIFSGDRYEVLWTACGIVPVWHELRVFDMVQNQWAAQKTEFCFSMNVVRAEPGVCRFQMAHGDLRPGMLKVIGDALLSEGYQAALFEARKDRRTGFVRFAERIGENEHQYIYRLDIAASYARIAGKGGS